MAKIYLFKESEGTGVVCFYSETRPANTINIGELDGEVIPTDRNEFIMLSDVSDIISARNSVSVGYKVWRDGLKTAVAYIGQQHPQLGMTDEQAGMDWLLSNDTEAAALAAEHNIGTGSQIVSSITAFKDRENASYAYLCELRGVPNSVRKARSLMLEAAFWAACKSVLIEVAPSVFVSLPQLVLIDLAAATPAAAGELTTSFLDLYEDKGLVGVCDGDGTTGVGDYLLSQAGSRFAGNGFLERSGALSPAFDGGTMEDFRDYVVSILRIGVPNEVTIL